MKNKISSDLSIMLVWTIATFVFVIVPELEHTIVRTILGLSFVLFIPGYVLIAASFPKKDDLEAIERMALSFGLSIAIVPLIGLGLSFTFGIRMIPILATLCTWSIGLIFIAEYRRGQLPEKQRFVVPFHKIYQNIVIDVTNTKVQRSKTDNILTVILIFSIVLTIGILIYIVTIPKIGEKFTEFYILNSTTGKADNYSTELKLNNRTTLLMGVVNHEYSPVNYTIQISLDKNRLTSKQLKLNHNETWEQNVTFVPNKQGTDMKLRFLLFKENNFTDHYRYLHLWVNVT